jgi:hypothetical protein
MHVPIVTTRQVFGGHFDNKIFWFHDILLLKRSQALAGHLQAQFELGHFALDSGLGGNPSVAGWSSLPLIHDNALILAQTTELANSPAR